MAANHTNLSEDEFQALLDGATLSPEEQKNEEEELEGGVHIVKTVNPYTGKEVDIRVSTHPGRGESNLSKSSLVKAAEAAKSDQGQRTAKAGESGDARLLFDLHGDEMEIEEQVDVISALRPSLARKIVTRYDIKLVIPPTEPKDALEALSDALKEVWAKQKEADKKLVVYPLKADSRFSSLTTLKEFPEKLPGIQEYFNRTFIRKTGGVLYISVRLGHDNQFKDMHSEVDWWLSAHGYGWYYKSLQCESSVCIGWLLYSTIDMDKSSLAAEIFKQLGIRVGLRFRAISVNTRSNLS